MATSLEHRSTFAAAADVVFETLVDEAFLTERLREIGGRNAALLDHTRDGERVRFRMRQGVDAAKLPSAVRSVLGGGDLVVEREERWRPEDGGHVGTSRVAITGVPGELQGRSRLSGTASDSTLVISAQVRVSIPLIGGKLERVVADQVGKLLATEAEYAEKWLAERA